jgi:hypothetical protein
MQAFRSIESCEHFFRYGAREIGQLGLRHRDLDGLET